MKAQPRAAYRLNRLNETMLIEEVRAWAADVDYNYYLGFGGAGDALLLLAVCWDDPKARVIFFYSRGSISRPLFDLFDMDVMMHPNVAHSPLGKLIWSEVKNHPNFRSSAHLPDDMNLNDWTVDPAKYGRRMVRQVPWADLIGRFENPFPTRGIVVICPSGSDRIYSRQRFLSETEYRNLVTKLLLQNYTVVTMDAPEKFRFYPPFPHKHSIHCSADSIQYAGQNKESFDLASMLKIVNAAEYCISTDTWLVTYCNLTGKPVKVVQTRFRGAYYPISGVSDYIFLNKEFWPNLEVVKAEDLCLGVGRSRP